MEKGKEINGEKQSLPRFSIWNIFLWSAICAVLLNSAKPAPADSGPFGPTLAPVFSSGIGFRILSAFCESGTICVSIVLLATLAKRARPEPGHWLAIASLVAAYTHSSFGYFYAMNNASEMPKLILVLAFTFCGVHLCGWPWYWRSAIFVIGVNITITNFYFTITEYFPFTAGTSWTNPLLHGINLSVEWMVVLLTMFAIALDLYRKQYRDWLHWIGLLYCVMHWAHLIQHYLIPPLYPDLLGPFGGPDSFRIPDPFGVPDSFGSP